MSLLAPSAPIETPPAPPGGPGRAARLATGVVLPAAALLGLLVLLAALAPLVGVRLVTLQTGSMSPDLPAGSVLLARDVPASAVAPGDIVTVMRADGSPVTHRVVSVTVAGDGAALVLKGDANDQADPRPYLVTRVGQVIAGVPWGGALFALASSPGALPVLVAIVTALVLWAWWPPRARPAHRAAAR